jgi:hypothetical protein
MMSQSVVIKDNLNNAMLADDVVSRLGHSVANDLPSTMVFSVVESKGPPKNVDRKKFASAKKDALKSMLVLENKKKQDVFLESRQKNIQKKRDDELKDLRKSVNITELESLEDNEEMCCQ